VTKSSILISVVVVVVVLVRHLRSRPSGQRQRQQPSRRPALPKPDSARLEIRGFELYVRLDEGNLATSLQTLASMVGDHGTLYPRAEWAVVPWDDFRAPDALLREISTTLGTEVLWLSFQKQVDAFEFQHWAKGRLLRRLTFGCYEQERTWEKVEGQAEAWEAAALLDPKDLTAGSEVPSIDGRDTAEAVAVAYALPGWE
jgi:hypothetical protein